MKTQTLLIALTSLIHTSSSFADVVKPSRKLEHQINMRPTSYKKFNFNGESAKELYRVYSHYSKEEISPKTDAMEQVQTSVHGVGSLYCVATLDLVRQYSLPVLKEELNLKQKERTLHLERAQCKFIPPSLFSRSRKLTPAISSEIIQTFYRNSFRGVSSSDARVNEWEASGSFICTKTSPSSLTPESALEESALTRFECQFEADAALSPYK